MDIAPAQQATTTPGLEDRRRRILAAAHLNAFITLSAEDGPGEVVAVKDLIDVAGLPTTGGSLRLPLTIATTDAPVIQRLRAHGCVVIGKTNLHEWAYGVTSHNPHFGNVGNPYDPRRVAGGSSGGSAVAVAMGMCDWAIGTDTGGSIRIPASLCGVVGIKPTLGSVSTDGMLALSPSLDTVGPLARTVAVAAHALARMGGAAAVPASNVALDDLRLATPRGWVTGLDRPTQRLWAELLPRLEPIRFADYGRLAAAAIAVLDYEAREVHDEALRAAPERYGLDVRRRLERGLAVSRRQYRAAIGGLERMRERADGALDGFDALVLPATPCVAPLISRRQGVLALAQFTRPFNATGQPVVAVPAPVAGLPAAIQLVGRRGTDGALIAVAAAFESAWQGRRTAPPSR